MKMDQFQLTFVTSAIVCLVNTLTVLAMTNYIPTYYIDPNVLSIFGRRVVCMRNQSAVTELHLLKQESASQYFRSHELYAHMFFVENEHNPYRRHKLEDAEFEYIPLLPLHWRVESAVECSYTELVKDILKFASYEQERNTHLKNTTLRPKFTVASTYNMRTEIGAGMPTQLRKGDAWNTVSAFVMGISIGHYEVRLGAL